MKSHSGIDTIESFAVFLVVVVFAAVKFWTNLAGSTPAPGKPIRDKRKLWQWVKLAWWPTICSDRLQSIFLSFFLVHDVQSYQNLTYVARVLESCVIEFARGVDVDNVV